MAPREEYKPFPTVAPRGPREPQDQMHINFPDVHVSDAIGKAMQIQGQAVGDVGKATALVGHSLDSLGKQFDNVGNELWQRAVGLQELQNETAAKKASIEYDTWANQKSVDFNNLNGEAASESVLKSHMAELQSQRDKLKEKLTNPDQQRRFDNHTEGTMLSGMKSAASHAATEAKKSALGASDARINLNSDQFSKTDDLKESQRIMDETAKEFFNTKAPLMGLTKDAAVEKWKEQQTKMWGSKILRMAEDQPGLAMKMLEANKDVILDPQYTALYDKIKDMRDDQTARFEGDTIHTKDKDAPLEDKLEQADKKAKEIDPDNYKLRDKLRTRVTGDDSIYKREQADLIARDFNTARMAAYGFGHPDGRLPTSKEELFAIPGAKEAYERLEGLKKGGAQYIAQIDSIWKQNAKGDYPASDAARSRFRELFAEAHSPDPADRERFKTRDLSKEKMPLNGPEGKSKLIELQQKATKTELEQNPSVQRAWSVAGRLMPDSIRTRRSSAWKEVAGALDAAISEEMKANGGVPLKDEKLKEIVSRVLQDVPGTGWFGSGVGAKTRYEQMMEPSNDEINEQKNRYPWMTEDEIKEGIARSKWHTYSEEYEKLKSKGPAAPVEWKTVKPPSSPTPASK